jgi:hypothetical protein
MYSTTGKTRYQENQAAKRQKYILIWRFKMKKLLNILLVLALFIVTFAGCELGGNSSADPVKITLSATELTLEIGEQAKVEATVENSTEDVTWTSSNANVARVNSFGQLQALALGTTDITAKIGEVSAKCVVTVAPVLNASETDLTLIVPGDDVPAELSSVAVTFSGNPEVAANAITVVSANEAIAKYEDGNVVAVAEGATTITATATNGAKAVINVKVEALNAQPTNMTFKITTAVDVPEYCGVFLAGTLTAWGPSEYELTRAEGKNNEFTGTFTFDFTDLGNTARNAEYKFILVSKLVEGANVTYGNDTGWEQVNGSNTDNRKMFVNKDETITVEGVVFQSVPANPNKPEITNTINITLTFTEAVDHDVYLIGPFNSWTTADANAKFTASADKKTFTLTITFASKGTEFECKINKGDWDWNYGSADGGVTWASGGDNCKATLTGDATAQNTRTVNFTWAINNTPAAE